MYLYIAYFFRLFYLKYWNTYCTNMMQYGKSLQYCTSNSLGFFGMQTNNHVLQLLHIKQKSSLQLTHISHMYALYCYKTEYHWQQIGYSDQLYRALYWKSLHNSHHIIDQTTKITCSHMCNACVQTSYVTIHHNTAKYKMY